MANDADESSVQLTLVWSLLIVTVICAFFLQRYKVTICPPSSAAMIMGMIFGGIYRLIGKSSKGLRFSEGVFFYGLLPPIVFAAGFNLKKRHFLENFGSIMLFAVLGTIISTLVFGLGTWFLMLMGLIKESNLGDSALIVSLLYGSLISAIDPVATLSVFSDVTVPPLLYNLVFGESVMNDAVAIVLFNTFKDFYDIPMGWGPVLTMVWNFLYIFVGSLVLGVLLSLPASFVLKRFQLSSLDGAPSFSGGMYEITILFMDAYLAYLMSEACGMSGICSLFMAGVCHAHYSYYSMCEESQITARRSLEAVAFLAETFLFAYLGLQVSTFDHVIDWGLLVSGIPLCLLSRAANIFPLGALANVGRQVKIPRNLQCMQWAVGLRGAVAYALCVHLPTLKNGRERKGNPAIETATLLIVCASTLLLGGGTVELLHVFGLDEESVKNSTDPVVMELQDVGESQRKKKNNARWKQIDRQYLKPLFGGRERGRDETLLGRADSSNYDANSDGQAEDHHDAYTSLSPSSART